MASGKLDLDGRLVLSENGDSVGSLADVLFDEGSGQLTGLVAGEREIGAERIRAVGPYCVIVAGDSRPRSMAPVRTATTRTTTITTARTSGHRRGRRDAGLPGRGAGRAQVHLPGADGRVAGLAIDRQVAHRLRDGHPEVRGVCAHEPVDVGRIGQRLEPVVLDRHQVPLTDPRRRGAVGDLQTLPHAGLAQPCADRGPLLHGAQTTRPGMPRHPGLRGDPSCLPGG